MPRRTPSVVGVSRTGTAASAAISLFFPVSCRPPRSAILASGTIKDTPVVVDGEVAVRPILKLTGSFDHRTVDGAEGARYLSRVQELLLEPAQLV